MDSKLEKMFKKLVAQGKTFAEAKKARTGKTALSILRTRLVNKRRKLVVGSLERHHRAATILTQVCGHCDGEQDIVECIHVWSHSPLKGIDVSEITATIRGKGMYDFHKDIPLVVVHARTSIAICASCLTKEYAAHVD